MRDTCRLLRPFEEATLFVSRQDYGMNDVIPLLHVLEQMLLTMAGQGAVDMAHRSQRHMTPVGAGQEEEDEGEERRRRKRKKKKEEERGRRRKKKKKEEEEERRRGRKKKRKKKKEEGGRRTMKKEEE
ncbi:unnamed protein product, partial [Staurois parvus]